MTLEKPWEKPFEKLLQELSQHHRGEISKPGSKRPVSDWGIDSSYYFYPMFHSELQGHKFMIEISEFPGSSIDLFESADNVEYLRVFVAMPTQYNIVVSHEDWLRQLKKKLHLDREFQTVNGEFDKRYYVRQKSDEDKQLLMDSRFQEMVMALEPFSVIQVLSSGVRWSRMITDKEQLDFSAVDNYLKRILELVKTIPTK